MYVTLIYKQMAIWMQKRYHTFPCFDDMTKSNALVMMVTIISFTLQYYKLHHQPLFPFLEGRVVCMCGVSKGANNMGREESVQGIYKSEVCLL